MTPDGFGVPTTSTVTKAAARHMLAVGFPPYHPPTTTLRTFNKTDARGSLHTSPWTDAILLKHEDSRTIPPATAPYGSSRPDPVMNLNSDLDDAISSEFIEPSIKSFQYCKEDP